jgi:hypothetical protein
MLGTALERSRRICLTLYQREACHPTSYLSAAERWAVLLPPEGMAVFAALYEWRDRCWGVAWLHVCIRWFAAPHDTLFSCSESNAVTRSRDFPRLACQLTMTATLAVPPCRTARLLDESTGYVLPKAQLIEVARLLPGRCWHPCCWSQA